MPMTLDFSPRLMPAGQAAHYLGISASKLRMLPIASKRLDGKRVWDRRDLDAYADDLPTHGETDQRNTCDALFMEKVS